MTPTPIVLATRQSSTEEEEHSVDSNRGRIPAAISPKSTPLKSSLKSERNDRLVRRQMSDEYKKLMTDNKNTNNRTSPPKIKTNGSTRSKASDNQTNGEIISDIITPPQSVKECNKYGFFVDSDKAESLP